MTELRTRRLTASDREVARVVFAIMARVFDEGAGELSDGYLERLLAREDFWAFGAFIGDDVVGGITAHALPMTRSEALELFIYDIAVIADHQRRGIGRRLVSALREAAASAGIHDAFVPADDEDSHALDFYRALGGTPAAVTIFTFAD
jgi:aminoglycoside 3-N-acetyltransferase I